MTTALNLTSQIERLRSVLLQTLDESIFFSELAAHMGEVVKSESIIFYKLREDHSLREVSRNATPVIDGRIINNEKGIINHVIKTKKAYFSNDTARDPLFSSEYEIELAKKELCIPIICEGIIISAILLQSNSEAISFSREDITSIISLLNQLEKPIKNLKMFISVKNLNEALLLKIEKREKELLENRSNPSVLEALKTSDKEIVFQSLKMNELMKLVEKLSLTDANILLTGESGTGKGLIANKIHCRSSRSKNAFAKIDCSSLNHDQMERELFGEEIIESNGERRVKVGLLEVANGGTLLLEEISCLSSDLQARIAAFIKDQQFHRLGSSHYVKSHVRIVASSTKDLKNLVHETKFREDLFYAIITVSLEVPALRDRTEDIELLADYFLNRGKDFSKHKTLSPCVIKTLKEYHWPGNIRELQNVLERAYILSDRMVIEEVSLLEESRPLVQEEVVEERMELENFMEVTLEQLEKSHICRILNHLGGNKTKTAKTLGITVKTLYNKLHSYGMIDSNKELSM
jgi:Nif-specific regulatory protein